MAATIANLRARIYEVLCDGVGVARPLLRLPPAGMIGDWPLSGATTSGGNVTALPDASGNGNDLAITGTGAEVTLATDADYGGQLVGVFGGGKYLARATFAGGNEAQPITVLCLGEITSGDGVFFDGDDGVFLRIGGGAVVASDTPAPLAATIADATPVASLTVFNGAATKHYQGADWTTPQTVDAGTKPATGITIGSNHQGSVRLTGKIARVAAWDHELDDAERKQAAAFLVGKYRQSIAPLDDRRFQRLRTSRGDRTRLAQRAKVQPIAHVSITASPDVEVVDELTDSHLYRIEVRVTRYYWLGFESDPDTVDATLDRAFDDGLRVRAALSHPANLVTTEAGAPTGLGGSSLRPRGPTEGDDPDDVASGADRLLERIDVFEGEFDFSPDA